MFYNPKNMWLDLPKKHFIQRRSRQLGGFDHASSLVVFMYDGGRYFAFADLPRTRKGRRKQLRPHWSRGFGSQNIDWVLGRVLYFGAGHELARKTIDSRVHISNNNNIIIINIKM